MTAIGNTVAAFLCSLAYSDDLSSFSPPDSCAYAWMWDRVRTTLSDVRHFSCEETDAQGLLAYSEQDATVYAVFRGTESKQDAVVDASVFKEELDFLKDNDSDIRVHSGFKKQFLSVAPSVNDYLDRHPGRSQVVVTGHSLGGALAVLCAAMIADAGRDSVKCVVFGCPRVGNPAFAKECDRLVEVQRVVVGSDPVTKIPTRLRWKHPGKQCRFVNGCRVRGGSGGDPISKLVDLPNPLCTGDHSMAGYIDSMARADLLHGSEPLTRCPFGLVMLAMAVAAAFALSACFRAGW